MGVTIAHKTWPGTCRALPLSQGYKPAGGDDWATGAEVRVRGSSSAVQMVKKQLSVQLRKLVNRDSGDGSGNSEDQADQVLADGERGIVRGLLQAQASSVSSSSGNKSNSGVVYEVGNEDDRSLMGESVVCDCVCVQLCMLTKLWVVTQPYCGPMAPNLSPKTAAHPADNNHPAKPL